MMGWKEWYEIKKTLEKQELVYFYDLKDNEDAEGFCQGLYEVVKEEGRFLECFPQKWKAGGIALEQFWLEKGTDIGGMDHCKCGKHVAIWSAGQGLIDIIERTLAVYEVNNQEILEKITKAIKEKKTFWNGRDPDLWRAIVH